MGRFLRIAEGLEARGAYLEAAEHYRLNLEAHFAQPELQMLGCPPINFGHLGVRPLLLPLLQRRRSLVFLFRSPSPILRGQTRLYALSLALRDVSVEALCSASFPLGRLPLSQGWR